MEKKLTGGRRTNVGALGQLGSRVVVRRWGPDEGGELRTLPRAATKQVVRRGTASRRR